MKDFTDDQVLEQIKASVAAENMLNLDNFNHKNEADMLWAMGRYIERNSKKVAKILFPWRPKGYVRATKDLGRYAENKATAMRCRLPGGTGVVAAQGYELICDQIFEKLPPFARW